MATEKWIAGTVGLTWTAAITSSTLNSIVNGNAIISDTALNNSSNLDIFFDVSFRGGSVTTVAPNYIGIYLYPLLDDGSTYGDGKFGTSAAGPPSSTYYIGSIVLPIGTQAITGALLFNVMPPGQFKLLVYNQAGVTLAGSGANSLLWRTYNRQIT